MALINCPECNRQVSDQAATCPECGHPLTASPGQTACSNCGASVSDKAVVCLKCGKDPLGDKRPVKSGHGRRNLAIGIVGLLVIAAYARIGGGSTNASLPPSINATVAKVAATATTQAAQKSVAPAAAQPTSAPPTVPPPTQAPPTAPPTAKPTEAPPPTVKPVEAAVAFSGSSMQQTRPFPLAGGNYTVKWSARPANASGGCYHGASLKSASGKPSNFLVNELLQSGRNASGETQVYRVAPGDDYYFDISSGCAWEISIAPL